MPFKDNDRVLRNSVKSVHAPTKPGSRLALGIGAAIISIGVAQYVFLNHPVQPIVVSLYYLPTIIAGSCFGWRAGGSAGLLAGALQVFLRTMPSGSFRHIMPEAGAAAILVAAGILAGVLAEQQRKRTRTLQKTTTELAEVYKELHENFELMKRNERLYAMGQLSAGLAHEIRNPLASIEGAAAVIKSDPDSAERRAEFLDIIQKECRRLNRLLTNFLEFARPQPPQYKPVEIARLFESVIALALHAIGRKPITLQQVVEPGIPTLECDPEQMKQVLLNLTINAIQATAEGEIMLQANAQNGKAQIQVRDPGCGMAPEQAGNLFDLFFTTKENGTGLGLPVAHRIVSQHGGVLTATNNEDKGMTFSILLPLRRENIL
jgi:signal transduction histidine kinase